MDKRMMMAWLQGQAQKQELTTTKMQQKRLGIFEQTGVPDKNKLAETYRRIVVEQSPSPPPRRSLTVRDQSQGTPVNLSLPSPTPGNPTERAGINADPPQPRASNLGSTIPDAGLTDSARERIRKLGYDIPDAHHHDLLGRDPLTGEPGDSDFREAEKSWEQRQRRNHKA